MAKAQMFTQRGTRCGCYHVMQISATKHPSYTNALHLNTNALCKFGVTMGSLSHRQIALYCIQLLLNCQCWGLIHAGWCSCRPLPTCCSWLISSAVGFWQANVCWEISAVKCVAAEYVKKLSYCILLKEHETKFGNAVCEVIMNESGYFFSAGTSFLPKHTTLCHIYSLFWHLY